MPKKDSPSNIGAWLEVDEKNKKVRYRADPAWLESSSDEERKITLAKLTILAGVYRRAGYAVVSLIKMMKQKL